VKHAAFFAAGDEAVNRRDGARWRVRYRTTGRLLSQAHDLGLDAGVLNQAAIRVAHTAPVRPACPEDAVLAGDRIGIPVFRPIVPGELLENLGVEEHDVALVIDNAGSGGVHGGPSPLAGFRALPPIRRV